MSGNRITSEDRQCAGCGRKWSVPMGSPYPFVCHGCGVTTVLRSSNPETTEISTMISDVLTNNLKARGEVSAAIEIEHLRHRLHIMKQEIYRLRCALRNLKNHVDGIIHEAING